MGGCRVVSGPVISVLINQGLLSEVEGLKVLATVAVSAIYQPKEAALGRICVAPCIAVLLNEFFDREVTSTDPDDDLIFLDLHEHSFLAVLVNTLGFSLKAHLVADIVGHVVDEISQLLIQGIVLYWVIDECIFRDVGIVFQLDDDVVESLDLPISIFQVL